MSGFSIFILAIEPSADKIGANLANALKERQPEILLSGIGGAAMSGAGISSDFDISDLAVMGYVEVLKSYNIIRRKIKTAVEMIMKLDPEAVVLIDSWGFMIRVAESLKQKGYNGKIIKYVAPQVWAMRPGRAKTLARFADHLLSIQTMDEPYFKAAGLPQTFVGNPMFDDNFSPDLKDNFRQRYGLGDRQIVPVLFGSRKAEIQSLFEPFVRTISKLETEFPGTVFATVISPSIERLLKPMLDKDPRTKSLLVFNVGEKKALFANSEVALACSGTVTTQLAMSGVPSVVAYKLNPLTYGIGKHLFRPDHISLVNISANERIIPEFLQAEVTPGNLSAAIAGILGDRVRQKQISEKLLYQIDVMKGKGGSASQRAASAIFNLLERT